jgi:hypothetical protein
MIAELLGVPMSIEESAITEYLKEHPDHLPFCCHRVYTQGKARGHGIPVPATGVREGLLIHLESLGALAKGND